MRKRVSLAQTLVLDPDIILMDEPFSALDMQTRQLMENEVLALWAEKKKAVLFITHDLDEAIAMSDRVVCLSAGPASHPIGEFAIDLARPRDVAEVRATPRFVELHQAIWAVLREEVLAGLSRSSSRHERQACAMSIDLRALAGGPAGRGVRRLAPADDARPAAELHVRERPPGGVLLRRAGQDLRPHLDLVRRQRRHLPAPRG